MQEPAEHARANTRKLPSAREIAQALRYAIAQISNSQAPTMAASLAFRTLFGFVPVLVVATIVARALLGDGFERLARDVIHALGLHGEHGAGAGPSASLGAWLESMVEQAAKVDLSAIGVVGALAVVFSAVWTMVAIESSFNAIYRAPSGRPVVRRVLIYWFVITAGPVLFAAIPLVLRSVADFAGADSLAAKAIAWAVSTLGSFVSLWALLTAAYAAVPNTRVDLRSAALGAFAATLLIESGKRFLLATLAGSFATSQLFASLGLLPLFMLWVYVMWLVVLFGLQTSAILQGLSRSGRTLASPAHRPDVFEPAEAIGCFAAICRRFREGRSASVETIVRDCAISPTYARELLILFERAGLAHRVDGDERRYAPSRPPESILQAEALRAGFAFADGGHEAAARDDIAELRDAQVAKLGDARF